MSFQALRQLLEPLDCTGSPFERGRAQGQQNQKQIRLCFNALFQSDLYALLHRGHWPESWMRRFLLWRSRQQLLPVLKRHLPQVWEQIQGLAAGSGVSAEAFLFFHQMELWLQRKQVPLSSGSILMIPARFSALEEPLLIRNYDAPYFFTSFNLLRQSSPEQGQRSLELALMPGVGAHSGMNEAGVVIAYNYAHGQYNPRTPIPVAVQVQQALQSCESAAEVVRFFERGHQSGGALVAVMDTRNDMYLLEVSGAKVAVKAVNEHLLIATNHYQVPEMAAQDVPSNSYFSLKHGLKALAGCRVRESSESRFDRLYELTGTRILFHPNDVLDYFKDHGNTEAGDDNTLCRHGDYYETLCSVLLRPLSRELHVSLGSPCDYAYRSFQWY